MHLIADSFYCMTQYLAVKRTGSIITSQKTGSAPRYSITSAEAVKVHEGTRTLEPLVMLMTPKPNVVSI